MRRNPKLNKAEKLSLVKKRLEQGASFKEMTLKYGVSITIIKKWVNQYIVFGAEGSRNRIHTVEFKLKVVQDFLSGESKPKLSIKYNIFKSAVYTWIKKYNSNQLKDYTSKKEICTIATKKYSKEEKLKIIKECIKENKDYKLICSKYSIRYSLVYQWVRVYERKHFRRNTIQ